MHEDAPKMSVAQSLAASTSQAKSEIVTEVPVEYDINSTEPKSTQSIEMDLKLAYVNPTSGHACSATGCSDLIMALHLLQHPNFMSYTFH
ncbi:unnamed protein product [Chrysodeixis includens]|uniref:Uncharacterized protein n=1 Tax=Chrysodeixis includens TaxID=689277 RepID=A0A9N8KP55_CHRIL|nr:unnamed protein product [Chrysodeixis includens]